MFSSYAPLLLEKKAQLFEVGQDNPGKPRGADDKCVLLGQKLCELLANVIVGLPLLVVDNAGSNDKSGSGPTNDHVAGSSW